MSANTEYKPCAVDTCIQWSNYIVAPVLIRKNNEDNKSVYVCKTHIHEGIILSKRQSNLVLWMHPQPVQGGVPNE